MDGVGEGRKKSGTCVAQREGANWQGLTWEENAAAQAAALGSAAEHRLAPMASCCRWHIASNDDARLLWRSIVVQTVGRDFNKIALDCEGRRGLCVWAA